MTKFHVDWRVISVINGPGPHDCGVRDGDRECVARGEVEKEAESEGDIRRDLTADLRKAFPETVHAGTYDIQRHYKIEITSVGPDALRERIKNILTDSISDFLYYDRKEDEELPRGKIEEMVGAGEITVDEMVEIWSTELRNQF